MCEAPKWQVRIQASIPECKGSGENLCSVQMARISEEKKEYALHRSHVAPITIFAEDDSLDTYFSQLLLWMSDRFLMSISV